LKPAEDAGVRDAYKTLSAALLGFPPDQSLPALAVCAAEIIVHRFPEQVRPLVLRSQDGLLRSACRSLEDVVKQIAAAKKEGASPA
jgi:hypothetical protein